MGMEIDNKLYKYMENDEEFKKTVVELLEIINNFYCEDVYDKYKSIGNVIDELNIENSSDEEKNDLLILKNRIDDYEEVYNDFLLHKPLLKSLGLIK